MIPTKWIDYMNLGGNSNGAGYICVDIVKFF